MKFLKKFATRAEYEAYMADNMENYPHVGYIADEGAVEYVKEAPPMPDKMPLHFEALEDLTVSFSLNAIEYSLDNKTWQTLPAATATPTISAGSKVYFRASGLTANSNAGIGTFSTTGKFNATGNVMSMVDGANFADVKSVAKNGLSSLFKNCTGLINADQLILPATTLAPSCYALMFYGCKSLVNAPELPATQLVDSCYFSMFNGCTNLVNAPALPAMALASNCYYYMFNGCTNLVNAPELPAIDLMSNCYQYMFGECTSLVNAPALPAMALASNCYYYMFGGCTSLVNAPELPAIDLMSNCYQYMFYGCKSLQYIKAMFTTTPSSSYTSDWVKGVKSVGTFVKNAAATWSNTFGTSAIPTGWTVETATE